jgi:flagellar hook-associated protein 1
MGLSASLSNALSGMAVGQGALEVVSRNVANAGTPGYHKQTLSVIETTGNGSSFARLARHDVQQLPELAAVAQHKPG